ncbi:hypothetical protein RO21_03625 [[Actinobacillus] muris]|uniref:Uncharacterized protein n=1 Tax=Muribacter muris TaxID=67855 RepID=A0A0J5P6P7_9PAST|nr:hypothetical protein [Muribacter muris]KMK51926.1 hypothetical protein RO21_03625 [[Actinobacillus] muris] [Muribacter muris]
MKETKNSALITAQAFNYQNIVALEKCFEMQEGDTIYIEKDGDISHYSNNPNMRAQTEVKDVKAPLTDHHETFWKTLKNWLAPEFNHKKYKNLILHTTQSFGKKTQLSNWNDKIPQEKFQILKNIFDSSSSESEIAKMQQNILNTDKSKLLEIIEKVVLITESFDKGEILNRIKSDKLLGIPENNQQVFIENLIGFIYELGNKDVWAISYRVFKEKFIDLTSRFSRKEFTFPEFKGGDATDQEITENETKVFVTKIKDIDYEEVIPSAIGNWLEFTKSLAQDLDNSPIYHDKTKKYHNELIAQYTGKHRQAKRNNKNPQDLYDEIINSEPLLIDNYRPPFAYRNGIMHEAMDTNANLKWDTK